MKLTQRFITHGPLLIIGVGLFAIFTPSVKAMDYGINDARGLAMGGTVIAVGNTSQAAYYNPALLAFHEGDEDKNRDGRIYFPTIVARAADTVDAAISATDDNLDTALSEAINAFNAQRDAISAGQVADSSRDIRSVLGDIANKNLNLDAFVGLSVSEPGDHEGGAFYLGVRAIAGGTANVTPEDFALLDEYIGMMDEIAAGANAADVVAAHPNLIDANGQLTDPTVLLNSSADVSALAISEWGLALAKEFTFWGQAISFGVTPKMMRVDAYRDNANFNNGAGTDIDQFSETKSTHMAFNADFGIAAIFRENYRLSFAIKDTFAKDFSTKQAADPITGLAGPDLIVKLHPRSRMGLGYVNKTFSIGIDYDLQQSTPMATEAPNQDISLGAEYQVLKNFALRLGYKRDLTDYHGDVASGGIGYQWRRFVAEIAYSQGNDIKGGALQLGWTF
ncbi:MAG: conjugal transfer protein TraF [Pseudomonadota bacterium]